MNFLSLISLWLYKKFQLDFRQIYKLRNYLISHQVVTRLNTPATHTPTQDID